MEKNGCESTFDICTALHLHYVIHSFSSEWVKDRLHSILTVCVYVCARVCLCPICVCECSQQTRGQAWKPPAECYIDLLLVNKQLDPTGGSMRLSCLPASQRAFLLGRHGSLRSRDPAVAWKLQEPNITSF